MHIQKIYKRAETHLITYMNIESLYTKLHLHIDKTIIYFKACITHRYIISLKKLC